MFIQTETTPNPATLKFVPGRPVLSRGTAEYQSETEAKSSPLAKRLLGIEGVSRVFLGPDFISITKAETHEWYVLKPSILGLIMEHFTAGLPVMAEDAQKGSAISGECDTDQGGDSEIIHQIKELLEARVRPAVAQDGGDIIFQRFEDGVVYLSMRGACAGCPSSTATLKMGVENMLRHYIPEVKEVRAAL